MSILKTLTYKPLSTIAGVKIGRCTGTLANALQCWRAADVLCTETTETKADPAKKIEASKTERSWQLCHYHVEEQKRKLETKGKEN